MWHTGDGMGWWMLWGGLMMVLFWGGIIALIVWTVQSLTRREDGQGQPGAPRRTAAGHCQGALRPRRHLAGGVRADQERPGGGLMAFVRGDGIRAPRG